MNKRAKDILASVDIDEIAAILEALPPGKLIIGKDREERIRISRMAIPDDEWLCWDYKQAAQTIVVSIHEALNDCAIKE